MNADLAAPPDDGGGQGSYTTPGDVLQAKNPAAGELRNPPLHVDTTERPRPKPRLVLPLIVALIAILVIAAVTYAFSP